MPRMWELPEVEPPAPEKILFSLRHCITVTDYTVRVVAGEGGLPGTWVKLSRLQKLPLTGLTKKILRHAGIIQSGVVRGLR